jgi:hypothetical protein
MFLYRDRTKKRTRCKFKQWLKLRGLLASDRPMSPSGATGGTSGPHLRPDPPYRRVVAQRQKAISRKLPNHSELAERVQVRVGFWGIPEIFGCGKYLPLQSLPVHFRPGVPARPRCRRIQGCQFIYTTRDAAFAGRERDAPGGDFAFIRESPWRLTEGGDADQLGGVVRRGDSRLGTNRFPGSR